MNKNLLIAQEIINVFADELYKSPYNISYNSKDNVIVISDKKTSSDKNLERIKKLSSIFFNQTLKSSKDIIAAKVSVDLPFYEKVYNALSSMDTKKEFLNLIYEIVDNFDIEDELHQLTTNSFINYFIIDYCKHVHEDFNLAWAMKNLYEHYPEFTIEKEALDLLIINCVVPLQNADTQLLIKRIVEKDFSENMEQYKKLWPKVDVESILPQEYIVEGFSHMLMFNKVYLHSLTMPDLNEEDCLQRMKLLVKCLNKKSAQLKIDNVFIDTNDEKHYKLFISTPSQELVYKNAIKKIVLHVAGDNTIDDTKDVSKIISYELLNSTLEDGNTAKKKNIKI
jgi:hypothetical protein